MSLLHPFKERSDGRKIRYAVVGAGWIAQEDFMPGVEPSGNSEITALVTGDPAKARALAEKYGIPHIVDYHGYHMLLNSGWIDAVYIALPNNQHREYAEAALKLGIHVLCEKPMAPSEEDCLAMIEAAKQGNAKLMIAYRLHFEEATLAAIDLVQSGQIGEPRLFSSLLTQQVDPANHRTVGENWAGPIPDMGTYPINAVRNLFQAEPLTAYAASASKSDDSRFAEVPEMVTVTLQFPGERIGQFTVSYGANALGQYRVAGTEGDLEVSPGYTWTAPLAHRMTIGEKMSEKKFSQVDQFAGETRYFSNCILDDVRPQADGEEGLADVRVMLAIEKSLASGKAEPVTQTKRAQWPTPDQVQKVHAQKPPELVDAAPADNS